MEDAIWLSKSEAQAIFEEWMKRYQEDPNAFDHDTRDAESYGDSCQQYVFKLHAEMFA